MTTCKTFEELEIWQMARKLVGKIYELVSSLRDLGFKSQIERAAVSIMNNIAEGFERQSDKEFCQFLSYSKGSCGEVRSMLYLAEDFRFVTTDAAEALRNEAALISQKTKCLMNYLSGR